MINVLIVEDDRMASKLLEMFLQDSKIYKVAATVESASMAELFCSKGMCDLILMDVCTSMNASGLDAAEKIKAAYPEIKIIIITSQPEISFIERAKCIGVDSFWYKSPIESELLSVMDRTVAGEQVFPETPPTLKMGCALSVEFTDRELDVLRELITGDTNKEIADRLNMSQYTVRDYIQSMLDKTGFRSRTELAVKARELGIIIPENKK